MAISKKIRFEVFKRDNFTCGYCGKTPPEVTLEVDHINPKSKKGSDDINNLLTACFACNRGKRNISLDKIPNSIIENMEILKEKEIQLNEYNKFLKKINRREMKDIIEVENIFIKSFKKKSLTETFKNVSIKNFLNKLPKQEVIFSMELACAVKKDDPEIAVKYFCGICWNKIRGTSCPTE